jgi:hypothetical protein
MMRVDAADTTEIVFRRHRVPLIQREHICSLGNPQPVQWNTGDDGAFSSAKRTIAASQFAEAILEVDLKFNDAAMATSFLRFHDFVRYPMCCTRVTDSR